MTHEAAMVVVVGGGAFNQSHVKPRLCTTGLGRLSWDYTHLHRHRRGKEAKKMGDKILQRHHLVRGITGNL